MDTPFQPDTSSQPSEELLAEGEEVVKKLQQTLGMGNEILSRAKAVARATEERTKRLIGQPDPPTSASSAGDPLTQSAEDPPAQSSEDPPAQSS